MNIINGDHLQGQADANDIVNRWLFDENVHGVLYKIGKAIMRCPGRTDHARGKLHAYEARRAQIIALVSNSPNTTA